MNATASFQFCCFRFWKAWLLWLRLGTKNFQFCCFRFPQVQRYTKKLCTFSPTFNSVVLDSPQSTLPVRLRTSQAFNSVVLDSLVVCCQQKLWVLGAFQFCCFRFLANLETRISCSHQRQLSILLFQIQVVVEEEARPPQPARPFNSVVLDSRAGDWEAGATLPGAFNSVVLDSLEKSSELDRIAWYIILSILLFQIHEDPDAPPHYEYAYHRLSILLFQIHGGARVESRNFANASFNSVVLDSQRLRPRHDAFSWHPPFQFCCFRFLYDDIVATHERFWRLSILLFQILSLRSRKTERQVMAIAFNSVVLDSHQILQVYSCTASKAFNSVVLDSEYKCEYSRRGRLKYVLSILLFQILD